MIAASLTTKYLVLAFSDVIAFRITSATCIGEVANSAYGESELVVFFRRFRILK